MHKNILINWSVEFGPIVLFFASLQLQGKSENGFVFSTALFTLATIFALSTAYIREKRIALFPIVAGGFVIVFGLLTVFFNQPYIFIFKDTVYNGAFFFLMLGGLIRGKGTLKPLFTTLFDISDEGWRILSIRWMVMFFLLALSNELIWHIYSQQAWVVYKFFATILTIVFGFYQIFVSRKYRNPTASKWGLRIIND